MPGIRVLKCPRCNRLFTKDRHPVCPECWRTEQENLDKVRRFLDENAGATAVQVADGTGVSEKDVIRFIKEGHLVAATGHAIEYPCDTCGKPISVGRFCPTCGEKLTKGLEGASKKIRRRADEDEDDPRWKKTGPGNS